MNDEGVNGVKVGGIRDRRFGRGEKEVSSMLTGTRTDRGLVSLMLALGLVIAACAPATTAPTAAAPTAAAPTAAAPTAAATTAKPFRVALIVSGALADGSWNQFQFESMKEIAKSPGLQVSFSENVDIPDFERVAGDFCRQGYDLIIGHTFDYQTPALKVAKNCPNTKFAIQGAWMFDTNVAGLTVWPCEGGYLAGVLGGLLTRTNKLGLIGGFTYAPTQVCFHEAFKQGAKSVNPKVAVSETWTGTWSDVAVGYEATNAQINNGTDFVAISLSGPGFGAINAAKDHNAKGGNKVYVVGAFVDMNSRAPGTVITSTLWKTTQPTLKLIEVIREGKFAGKNYEFFMADGSTDLAPYHQLESDIPSEVRNKVAQVRQDLMSGKLKLTIVKEAPK